MTTSVGFVFLAALMTAFTTGLGALPFLFVKQMSRQWLGVSNAIAAGLMLGASHALVAEGSALHAPRTVAGLVIGALLVAIIFACYRTAVISTSANSEVQALPRLH